jgi:hypothetical protein
MQMYNVPPVKFWPAAQDPKQGCEDSEVAEVYRECRGHLSGPQALIFIRFDPAIKLQGFKTWTGVYRGWNFGENKTGRGIGEGPYIDGRAASGVVELNSDEECEEGKGKEREWYKDVEEVNRAVVVDRKGKSKANASVSSDFNTSTVQVSTGYRGASATASLRAGSSGRNAS